MKIDFIRKYITQAYKFFTFKNQKFFFDKNVDINLRNLNMIKNSYCKSKFFK